MTFIYFATSKHYFRDTALSQLRDTRSKGYNDIEKGKKNISINRQTITLKEVTFGRINKNVSFYGFTLLFDHIEIYKIYVPYSLLNLYKVETS